MCTTMNSVKRAKGRSISKFLIWPSLAVAFVCFALAPVAAEGPSSRAPQTLRSFYEQTQKKPRLAKEHSAARNVPSSPLFLEAPQYDAASTPQFVAAGDFNGDGKVDLAVANYCVDPTDLNSCLQSGSSVNVLLGNGDGTFQPHVDYFTGTGSVSIVVGDFNHDGKQDIAVANICSDASCVASSISVLLGKGNGTFHPHVDYATGPAPLSIAAGDLNSDGNEDLVTADFAQGTVSVLVGNGDGTFRHNVDYPTDTTPIAVAIADFNGDHKLDLVTANYSPSDAPGDLSILLGNGDGTFQAHQDFAFLGNPSTLAAGDLNGDGKLDIVTNNINCNLADSVVVLLGNGDGTFQSQVAYFTGVNCGQTQVLLADFNGDNKLDVASLNVLGNSVSVFPGIGDGTFPIHEAWGTGVLPVGVAVGDFNGDGRNDLAALNAGGTISVLLGNGDNTFQARIDSDTFVKPGPLASADFNQDGKVDLVTTNGNYSNMSILLGNGDGTFQAHVDYDTPTGPGSVVIGDFNLDGKPDFAVSDWCDSDCPSSFVSVFLGKGDGTFRPRVDYPVPFSARALATADFNSDGKPDMVVAFSGNPPNEGLRFFLGNGDGTFRAPVDLAMEAVGGIIAADFNGDGKWDLATMNGNNTVSILLGKGDGTFQAPVNYPATPSLIFSAAVGDINGDNKPDLVTTSIPSLDAGLVSIYMGNGDGTLQPHVDYDAGGSVWSVAIGDFDGDQHADLALPLSNGISVDILRGNGDGTFNPPTGYVTGWGPRGVAVTDFNADGKPDLAVTNEVSYTVSVLLNIADIPVFTLAANINGTGGGTVTFNPWGTTCSSNCSKSYANGTQITLMANASAGSTFTSWSGGGCSGTGTCTLTLTSDQTVTATFDLTPDFAVAVSALSPGTVNPGQSASSTIDVTAIAGFNSSVALTCSVSPKPQLAPQCSISPSSVTPGTPATLSVTTTGPQAGLASPWGRAELFYALWLPVCGLTLMGMVFPAHRKKTRLLGMLSCVLLFAALLLLPACGGSSGGSHGSSGTPPGTYTIIVTGTSGTTHSTTVTLKVQ